MAYLLPEAINSIANNSFTELEIIIINDGSTDDTAHVVQEIINRESTPIRYYEVSHRGKAASINKILTEQDINGNYVVFMDADDVLPDDSLQNRYRAITTSKVDLVVGEFAVTNLQGGVREVRHLDRDFNKNVLLNQFFLSPKTPFHLNSSIVSKELLLKTGTFDEALIRGQEVDYSIRLLKLANQIKILPEVVYHYRKYYRPMTKRLTIRLQTMRYRCKTINKHLNGIQKAGAIIWQTALDGLKLVFELFRNYR